VVERIFVAGEVMWVPGFPGPPLGFPRAAGTRTRVAMNVYAP